MLGAQGALPVPTSYHVFFCLSQSEFCLAYLFCSNVHYYHLFEFWRYMLGAQGALPVPSSYHVFFCLSQPEFCLAYLFCSSVHTTEEVSKTELRL